jgi:peroxiredoxin Q/BCP
MSLKAGDLVPDFTSVTETGQPTTLTDLLAEGPLVLFFYPAAFSSGCTAEACHFRDLAAEFTAVGAGVVGVSRDAVDKQSKFSETYGFGFPLLSDRDRTVARAFGVQRLGFLPNARATFVVDIDRRILSATASEINMNKHADRALETLRQRAQA